MGQDSRLPLVACIRKCSLTQVDKVHGAKPNSDDEVEYTIFFFGDNTQYCKLIIKNQFSPRRFKVTEISGLLHVILPQGENKPEALPVDNESGGEIETKRWEHRNI